MQKNGGMPVDGTQKRPPRAKKKLWLLLTVILLVVLSLIFLGSRMRQWIQERERTKLLTLVNREYPVEDDYNVEFTLLGEGQMVDSRCVDDLEALMEACRRAGGKPEITASFRTWGAQERVYEEALASLLENGLSREEAERQLERKIEQPGFSEHQLGLAVDFAEQGSELPQELQTATVTIRWLQENSWRYGFILRFPADKTGITGMDCRPWHYRYVGREAAAQIHELNLSLEEYIEMFYST